ncbi:MAG: hypothetical protein C0501_23340 [Isosphaera sp.]|nr:hypothetical protein [Isosphaera sp.]
MRARVFLVFLLTAAFTAVGVGIGWGGSRAGLWAWPPQPSSRFGVLLGVLAGAIVVFEMLYPVQKKWFRWRTWFGGAQTWLRWHVWLGLACLPVVLLHAGFVGFGGPLTTWTLALFLVVTASGVWGLVMQQWVPQKLLSEVVDETVASEIDRVGDYHADEADRVVEGLITVPPGARRAAPAVTGRPADELRTFRADLLLYLRTGRRSRSPLASATEAEARFARLRDAVPEEALPGVDRLRQLADLRRQWDKQAFYQSLLHNWLLVHLPLSVAMTGLMFVHAVRALKYW